MGINLLAHRVTFVKKIACQRFLRQILVLLGWVRLVSKVKNEIKNKFEKKIGHPCPTPWVLVTPGTIINPK